MTDLRGRVRVTTRVAGALLLIERDERSAASRADRCAPPPDDLVPIVVHPVEQSSGRPDAWQEPQMAMRLVLPRAVLAHVARLRNLRRAESEVAAAGTVSGRPTASCVPRIPVLLCVGAIRMVRLVDVARACGVLAPDEAPRQVERARRLLHDRLTGPVRAADVSASVGLHRTHLARLFRRWFGVPMMTYLYDARVERAVHLLATTTGSLSEVAAASGFADHAHFTRRFSRTLGVLPSTLWRLMRS